jgi:nucleoside-diphosphate-sugar epimerase
MQALIIGCGYLGRRVAALWLTLGYKVLALTRSQENAATLRALGVDPIVGDVLAPPALRDIPVADIVLYAVGYDRHAGTGKREVYVQGLANVLMRIAPRSGRFLYVSSTSVYGQDNGEWIDELSPCVPASVEGEICLEAEEIARSHFSAAANCTVLRFSGLYGPGRLLRRIESVRGQEPIRANPDGFLNLIHVDDGARIVEALAERTNVAATYLVTDNNPVRRRDYYSRLAELIGAASPIFQSDPADAGRINKRCSNARIRAELGDILRFPTFEVGLPDAITSGSACPPT